MKRIVLLVACASALILSACGGDSKFPEATGKASIRAINAIPTSPELRFLIEEILIGTATYTEATTSEPFDDLDYRFNFDTFFAGDTQLRRVASQVVDVQADRDYTFVIRGSLANPTITVWESGERTFDEADTVFEGRFGHTNASRGALDFYFADATVVPTLGNQAATLSFGEVSAPTDFAEGDYVLTITEAGRPADVLYVSATTSFAPRNAVIVTSFDGDANNNAPIVVRALSALGASFLMPDPGFPPLVEFFSGSMDLGISDIYDDEMLTSLRVSNHDFRDLSAEVPIAVGDNTFYYTPAGATTGVTLEGTLPAVGDARYRVISTGAAGALTASIIRPDRRPVETHAKLAAMHTSNNFDALDLYVVDAGQTPDDVLLPTRSELEIGVPALTVALAANSYDVYVTEDTEKVALAGPYRIDVVAGDIVDLIIVDTVDPALLDVDFLSGGPVP